MHKDILKTVRNEDDVDLDLEEDYAYLTNSEYVWTWEIIQIVI